MAYLKGNTYVDGNLNVEGSLLVSSVTSAKGNVAYYNNPSDRNDIDYIMSTSDVYGGIKKTKLKISAVSSDYIDIDFKPSDDSTGRIRIDSSAGNKVLKLKNNKREWEIS